MSSVGKGISYQLLPSSSEDSPTLMRPPGYNTIEKLPEDYTPSAPPPSEVTGTPSEPAITPGGSQPAGHVSNTESNAATKNGFYKLFYYYVTYSIFQNLRKHMKRENLEDPELDVNAHFASHVVHNTQRSIRHKKRVQCCSALLWCMGLLQVLVCVALPIAMLVTGIAGVNSCPYRSITIIIYLIAGGCLFIILVFSRTIPSLLTCYKNRNTSNLRGSKVMTGCICVSEILFFVILVPNLVMLFLGSYWIFDKTPKDCNGTVTVNCCETYVFSASAIYNILQYIIYAVSVVYVITSVMCSHCVKGRQKKQDTSFL